MRPACRGELQVSMSLLNPDRVALTLRAINSPSFDSEAEAVGCERISREARHAAGLKGSRD
jgi:hypothetical protein